MNKLPEKLSLLRKNTGLPQSQIAQQLMVPVSEYMNWENGNSIPDIDKLRRLAEFYRVDLVALLDNTMTFVMPSNPSLEQSATIPFQANNGINATQQLTEVTELNSGTKEADFGSTKVMDTSTLSQSTIQDDEDDDDYDEDDEEETVTKVKKQKTKKTVKKRSSIMILVGAIVAVVILAIILVLFNKASNSSTVSITDTNRLALTSQYSMYLQSDGSIKTMGQNAPDESDFDKLVQISAGENVALGLKSDGTVNSSNSAIDVSEWEDIIQIAAGDSHAVGLKNDGSVVCTGSDNACNVTDWQNVAYIYAGDDVTVAVTESGSFLSSGGVSIPSVTGVKGVTISDNAMYYITSNSSVAGIGLNGSTTLTTTSLTNVTAIAAGDDFVAALLKDGTVTVISDDEELVSGVENWSNVKYIAADSGTLIAITKDNKMYGIGDNTYNQYENTAEEEAEATATPTATAATQLATVSGVSFSESTEDVQISWSAVTNADYYEVSVSSINYSVNSVTTSASIPASSLTSGSTYAVTIIAKSNDSDTYTDSDAYTINYTYTQKTTQLDTPSGLTATVDGSGNWSISWNGVSNASSYTLYLNDEIVETIAGTSYTISGSNLMSGNTYSISVIANGDGSKYTNSGTARLSQTYTAPVSDVTVTIHYGDQSTTMTLPIGTVNVDDLGLGDNIVAGQTLNITANTFEYYVETTGE